jgi:OmpA-OmpF porin, OOP family
VAFVLGSAGLALLALLGIGCLSGAELGPRLEDTARRLREVEAEGAMRCAPRELALARSHVEFAELERDQGAPSRARQHLDVADENVRAAAELSRDDRCSLRER